MEINNDKPIHEDGVSSLDQDTPTIVLSQKDSEVFASALLHPPEPNEAFKKASLRYARIVKSE